MLSFSPLLWYNRFDRDFDFTLDRPTNDLSRDERSKKKKFGYQFFEDPLADGMLISRTMLDVVAKVKQDHGKTKIITPYNKTGYSDIRSFLKIQDRDFLTFADPGTWSFANELKLPDHLYETDELIAYYDGLSFDLAGSVDWPIIDKITIKEGNTRKKIDLSDELKEYRRNLTLELAQEFLTKCNKRDNLSFVPFGTVQGYDEKSYRDSLKRVLKMGYPYIAIGGLPASSEKYVLELIPMIAKEIRKANYRPGIHLYGRFPSPKAVKTFLECGVTSFDNNSSYIAACSSGNSWDPAYIENSESSPDFCRYNIRIPSPRSRLLASLKKKVDEDEWLEACKVADKTFKLFLRASDTMKKKHLTKFYDQYDYMNGFLNKYRGTKMGERKLETVSRACRDGMESRMWERCGCSSCSELGTHIMLTRGHPRIPHTHLHNTTVQFERYTRELKAAKKAAKYDQFDWSEIRNLSAGKQIFREPIK